MSYLKDKAIKYRKVFQRVGIQTKVFVITIVIQFLILEALAWTNFFQYLKEDPDDPSFRGGPEHSKCEKFERHSGVSEDYKGEECLLVYETTSMVAALAALFMVWLALHGVFEANLPELLAFMTASTLLTVPTIIIVASPGETLDWFYYVLCGSVILPEVIYLVLIYPVYKEYKWELFKRVGSDPEFISIYNNVQRWKAAMKLSLCMGLILLITSGVFSPIDKVIDIAVTVPAAFVILIAFQVVGYFAVFKEQTGLMIIFFLLHTAVPAFIGVKIWLFFYSKLPYFMLQSYQFVMAACVAGVIHIITCIFSVMCFRNFGKGLTDKKRKERATSINWDSLFDETARLLPNHV